VHLLKFLHGVDGRGVPLSTGLAAERTVFRKGGLNFGNPLGTRDFLAALPAGCFLRGFRMARSGAGLCRRRLRTRGALTGGGSPAYTHTGRKEHRQGQVGRFSHAHGFRLNRLRETLRSRRAYYCWLSAGTTPARNTVKTRSSERRSTLNTMFSPAFNFLTAAR
jgi:hypothetical protein